jgi:hypothetical protein
MRPLITLLALLVASPALARVDGTAPLAVAPPPEPPAALATQEAFPPTVRSVEWYGWQTLAADAGVAATWLAAYELHLDMLTGIGTAGYLAATPLIHAFHGEKGSGLVSVGLRVSLPLVGALSGILVESGSCPTPPPTSDVGPLLSACEGRGALVGFFGGMIVASIIDAVRATTIPGLRELRPSRTSSISWLPSVAPTNGGAAVGLAGQF